MPKEEEKALSTHPKFNYTFASCMMPQCNLPVLFKKSDTFELVSGILNIYGFINFLSSRLENIFTLLQQEADLNILCKI